MSDETKPAGLPEQELSEADLGQVTGGGSLSNTTAARSHANKLTESFGDPVGNYNFKVEIEG